MRSPRWSLLPLAALVATALEARAAEPAAAPARPEIQAYRVADGAIRVDGDDADWRAVGGAAFAAAGAVPALPANLAFANPDRGEWGGSEDFSFRVWAAADGARLYVLAEVHDQLLFNDAAPAELYLGDDFELFVDANPPAAQFAAQRNANARQFICVPGWVNPALPPGGAVWQAADNPGVTMASRLRPWGYVIEVAIPKALFPNWAADPALASVGFDVMLGDADSPGMDGPHGAIKHAGFLLSPGNHFQTSEKLGRLVLAPGRAPAPAAAPATVADPALRSATDLRAREEKTRLAAVQPCLDALGEAALAARSPAWTFDRSNPELDKAQLFALAKRRDLPAPVPALRRLCTPPPDGKPLPAEVLSYALAALAQRKALPATDWGAFYSGAADPQVRLTWVWCLGVNGDHAAVPDLVNLLTDANLRVRIKAAIALGALGDATALPALAKMAKEDVHSYARGAAETAATRCRGTGGQ